MRVKILDERFRRDPKHYVLQTGLAFAVVAAIIAVFGTLTHGAVVAALGASAFIAFAMPKHDTAQPRRLLGGHAVCMAVGLLCSIPFRTGVLAESTVAVGAIAAAAVAISMFIMVITNTEHPPAAGNALAFAIGVVTLDHILFTAGAVVFLSVAHRLLRSWLRDLA
ncbi:MAG: HPP family protein [Candidatus Bipolaricaulota bacterium]|nr:MAG: HPP family protein [Candidatus Bipolaricaulota bacterium]